MGHLDPFLQDLNGIGIIAMMVGISAVIVRVVFCKTMRDRIYTGVLIMRYGHSPVLVNRLRRMDWGSSSS